ncbi:hypothetical protein KCV07_g168, partial [Aureobasidium melanogenum]
MHTSTRTRSVISLEAERLTDKSLEERGPHYEPNCVLYAKVRLHPRFPLLSHTWSGLVVMKLRQVLTVGSLLVLAHWFMFGQISSCVSEAANELDG